MADVNVTKLGFVQERETRNDILSEKNYRRNTKSKRKTCTLHLQIFKKTFEKVPKVVVWWALKKIVVEKRFIRSAQLNVTSARKLLSCCSP